jgi:hypothetical protein
MVGPPIPHNQFMKKRVPYVLAIILLAFSLLPLIAVIVTHSGIVALPKRSTTVSDALDAPSLHSFVVLVVGGLTIFQIWYAFIVLILCFNQLYLFAAFLCFCLVWSNADELSSTFAVEFHFKLTDSRFLFFAFTSHCL